jgi:hypothetical protein
LLAASLCLAPLGWAAAQDQPQQSPDQQPHEHQEHQQQHAPQQQPHVQQAPQSQHAGGPGGGNPQFQHPAQTNAAPPRPPAGATASPAPPPSPSQFPRVQGPPQHQNNGAAAPATTAPQPLQQQQPPQRTTTTRGNFQSPAHGAAAFTQQHGGYAPTQFDHGHFYGHDYAHFSPHEAQMWHSGAWHHEFHDGRYGWWYAVDGIWYFYAEPVYPYPTYIPDVVYIPEEDEAPPPDDIDAPYEPAPASSQYGQPQYGQPPAYYYYFCQDTQAYYPYVTSCASPWQPVPAAPAPQ